MALSILSATSAGLCLGITGSTGNRITMQPEVSGSTLHFRILGLPAPYNTAPPLWRDFGDVLTIVREATVAQTVDIVFRRWQQHVVVGQVTVESGTTRTDWYGEGSSFGFDTFAGDATGPRLTWQDEQDDLGRAAPPPGYEFAYVELQNGASPDFLATRMRRVGVAPGQRSTTQFKFLRLEGYGTIHRDPKVIISVKTTPPAAGDCG